MNVIQLVWKHPCEEGTRLERFVERNFGPSAMLASFVGLGTRVVVAAPFYKCSQVQIIILNHKLLLHRQKNEYRY